MIKLSSIDHTQDITDVNQKFVDDAENVFVATQKWILTELKESPTISGGNSNYNGNSTKKESVRLPCFKGFLALAMPIPSET